MGARSARYDGGKNSFQEEIENVLNMQYLEKRIEKALQEDNIDVLIQAMSTKESFDVLLRKLCKDRYTGDFKIDIIMGAYYANVLAHDERYGFYTVKSKLLEYVFKNRIWGKEPYNSYGVGLDENNNEVAYFDVPGCGQVSFHLVNTEYDPKVVPEYKLPWCGKRNDDFPTHRRIKNYHDLMIALGYREYDTSVKEIWALKPINCFSINMNEKNTCYFLNPDEIIEILCDHFDYDEEIPPIEECLKIIKIKKVMFSKREGVLSTENIEDNEMKLNILQQNAIFDEDIENMLLDLGIIEREDREDKER